MSRSKDQNKTVKYALLKGRLTPRSEVLKEHLKDAPKPLPEPKKSSVVLPEPKKKEEKPVKDFEVKGE